MLGQFKGVSAAVSDATRVGEFALALVELAKKHSEIEDNTHIL